MMKIKGSKLFDNKEIISYISKFEGKITECNNKIEQLNNDIAKFDADIDIAIEADIMEGTISSKNNLQNISSRKANAQANLDTELKKLIKIKEIMLVGLGKLIPDASNQMHADLLKYNEIVEFQIYKQLQALREQQEILLLTLQKAHNAVITEHFEFNDLCLFAQMGEYGNAMSNESFHSNLFVPNRNYPELGSALLNAGYLPAIEDVLMHAQADANAEYNLYKEDADKEQLPQAKCYTDIDLQEHLDNLGGADE